MLHVVSVEITSIIALFGHVVSVDITCIIALLYAANSQCGYNM